MILAYFEEGGSHVLRERWKPHLSCAYRVMSENQTSYGFSQSRSGLFEECFEGQPHFRVSFSFLLQKELSCIAIIGPCFLTLALGSSQGNFQMPCELCVVNTFEIQR